MQHDQFFGTVQWSLNVYCVAGDQFLLQMRSWKFVCKAISNPLFRLHLIFCVSWGVLWYQNRFWDRYSCSTVQFPVCSQPLMDQDLPLNLTSSVLSNILISFSSEASLLSCYTKNFSISSVKSKSSRLKLPKSAPFWDTTPQSWRHRRDVIRSKKFSTAVSK